MKKLKALVCLLLALAMLLAFAACKKDDGTQKQPDSQSDTPNGEKEENPGPPSEAGKAPETDDETQLGYWIGSGAPDGIVEGTEIFTCTTEDYPAHLPWIAVTGSALYINLYDSLFFVYQDDFEDVRGALVESWEFSDDYLSVVMQVRPGVKFVTGNVCDAQAIVDCYNISAQYQPATFANIESMEATGELELTFKFKATYPDFLYKFAHPTTGVVDPAALEEFGPEDNRAAKGTGPYYVESYSAGEDLVLRANPDYAIPEKMPHIETVHLMVIPNNDTAVSAFVNGELQWMKSTSVEQYYTVQDSGLFEDLVVRTGAPQPFFYNMKRNPTFQNPAVREALAKMVDWQGLCDLVFDGFSIPLTSMWNAGTLGWVDATEYYYLDPDEALNILEEAGIKPTDITFEMLSNPNFDDLATALQAQFVQYDVTMTINTIDPSAIMTYIMGGDWDILNTHNGYGYDAIIRPYTLGLAENCTQQTIWFDAYDQALQDSLVDLYNQASVAKTFEEQCALCREITDICQQNYAFMGGYECTEFFMHANNLRNMVIYGISGYAEFAYMYLED